MLKNLVLGGVLGHTKAYFGTVQNQDRGSLHLHLLIWLNHGSTPAQLKENIQNKDFRENLLKYLEDVVKEDLDLFRGKILRIFRSSDLKYFCLFMRILSHKTIVVILSWR